MSKVPQDLNDSHVHRFPYRAPIPKQFFSTDRMQLFTDALFSIIATIMVIPLVKVDSEALSRIKDGKETLWNYMASEKLLGIVVFVVTFLLLTLYQHRHANLFRMCKPELTYRENAQLASINSLLMLLLCFFPWASALLALEARDSDTAQRAYLWPYPVLVILTSIVFMIMQRKLLLGKVSITEFRFRVSGPLLEIAAALACIATSLIVASEHAVKSMYALFLIPVGYVVRRYIIKGIDEELLVKFKGAVIENDRLFTFADGVFAITSTLLILELEPPESSSDDVVDYFNNIYPRVLAFVPTFLLTLGVWTGHYLIGHHMRMANVISCILNSIMLVFVSLIPVVFSLFVNTQTQAAQQLVTSVLMGCGVTQVFLLSYTRFHDNGSNFASYEGAERRFPYMIMRLLVIPFLSLFVLLATFITHTKTWGFYILYLSPAGMIISSELEERSEKRHNSQQLGAFPSPAVSAHDHLLSHQHSPVPSLASSQHDDVPIRE